MRKDVKLGFAIGGILLAVLVVYVLVISGGDSPTPSDKNKAVALATPDAKPNNEAKPAENTPAPAPAEQQPTGRRPGRNRFGAGNGGGGTSATPAPETPATPQSETPAKPETAPGSSDPFSSAPASTPPAALAAEASPASQPSADDHWSAALHTGLPVLMTSTPSNPVPAAPVPAVQADANLPTQQPTEKSQNGSGSPIMAMAGSNTPASVSGAEVPIRVSNPPPAAPEAKLPSATANPAKPVGADQHVIQPGETLSSIAAAAYGSAAYYPHLLRANPNIDPKRLRPGMTINLPPASQVKADASTSAIATATPGATPAVTTAKLDEKSEYRVESGDSLMKISSKLYGSIKNVDKLYDLNKTTIGPDKAKLKVGAVLKLPEPPTVKQQ